MFDVVSATVACKFHQGKRRISTDQENKTTNNETNKTTKKHCLVAKGKRTYFIIIIIFLFIASLVKYATTNVMSLFSKN